MKLSKGIETIINSLDIGFWADEYILKSNKHLKKDAIYNKYERLEKWVIKNGGTIKNISNDCYISNDYKCLKIQIRFSAFNECKQVLARVI